jgi:hypothetical protein
MEWATVREAKFGRAHDFISRTDAPMPDAQLMVLLWNVFFAKMRPIAAIIPARNCPYPEDETVSIKRAHAGSK